MSEAPSREMIEIFRRSPMRFREYLTVDGASNERPRFKDVMSAVQRKDFEARDPALLWLTRATRKVNGKLVPYEKPDIIRFFQQRSRGYSKTSDIAMDVLWVLCFSKEKIDAIVVAEDDKQARLLMVQADKLARMNPWLFGYVRLYTNKIVNEVTGSFVESVARDTGSSYGLTSDLVICDEFTHWTKEEMWASIYSTFGKKNKVIIVSCNAGKGNDWKWRARESFRTSPNWYFSAPDGHAPWLSETDMAEQRNSISPTEFSRLWLNRWQVDSSLFLEPHTIAECEDEELCRNEEPEPSLFTYFISFDYGEVKDRAVGTVSHWDGTTDTLYIDKMDVLAPECQETGSVLLRDVLVWLKSTYDTFSANDRTVYFVLDRYQLLSCIQELKEYVDDPDNIIEFEFASGNGNFEMSKLLRQKIINQQVKWYPDCGEIFQQDGQIYRPQGSSVKDTLATELAELIVVKRGIHKWRFDHPTWGHDDRAFTVGAVLWFISKSLRESDEEQSESESIYH